jgi:hypothetical protein
VSDDWLSSWWPGCAEVVGAPGFESRLLGDGTTAQPGVLLSCRYSWWHSRLPADWDPLRSHRDAESIGTARRSANGTCPRAEFVSGNCSEEVARSAVAGCLRTACSLVVGTRDLIDRFPTQRKAWRCVSGHRATYDRKMVFGVGAHVLASIETLPAHR